MATRMDTHESPGTTHTGAEAPFWPGLKSFEESVRQAQRMAAAGLQATDRLTTNAVSEVRQHPLRAVAFATAGGAIAGCLIGFLLGGRTFAPRKDDDWIRVL